MFKLRSAKAGLATAAVDFDTVKYHSKYLGHKTSNKEMCVFRLSRTDLHDEQKAHELKSFKSRLDLIQIRDFKMT